MEQVKELLKTREKQLLHIKKEKEKSIEKAPEGTLKVCDRGEKTQYYHRAGQMESKNMYIREKDINLAQKLAQKDYDKKVLRAIEKELSAIRKYQSSCPEKEVEQIYENLHKERQKLVKPIMEPEEEFIRKWESVEYQGKEFYEKVPEIRTMKGERVRSKSELIIADLLNKEGIPYRYEFPIHLKGLGKVYPDFTILNKRERKEMHWEHFGMMDDPEYVEKAIKKIEWYENNGIFPGDKLILTYETKMNPINPQTVMLMIQKYLL